MEVLIRDSEIVLNNLQDSEIRTQINADSVLTRLVILDSDITIKHLNDSQIEGR